MKSIGDKRVYISLSVPVSPGDSRFVRCFAGRPAACQTQSATKQSRRRLGHGYWLWLTRPLQKGWPQKLVSLLGERKYEEKRPVAGGLGF